MARSIPTSCATKDLIADILPPLEYILESYLVVLQLAATADANEIESLATHLAELKHQFDERQQVWRQDAGLDAALRETLVDDAGEPARQFYRLVESDYLPAVRGGNTDLKRAKLKLLRPAYDAHRSAIDKLVTSATAQVGVSGSGGVSHSVANG